MHDWTFSSLSVDWKTGDASLVFLNPESQPAPVVIRGISLLNLPRKREWGMSVSVNSVSGPVALADGNVRIEIEMQSGDLIEIIADSILLPSGG